MTSFKAALLLLVAVAVTEASVKFADNRSNVYWVSAGNNECRDFPSWINDRATTYEITEGYNCMAYSDNGCNGNNAYLSPTEWKVVPFPDISSVKCWK